MKQFGMQFFFSFGADFENSLHLLKFVSDELLRTGIVRSTYCDALIERELLYPTGIVLSECAVAIPHCEVEHAVTPALYVIRPSRPVQFRQADDNAVLDCELVIVMVVSDPAEQVRFLRPLFRALQVSGTLRALIAAKTANEFSTTFMRRVALFESDHQITGQINRENNEGGQT